jgi:hypothetical protein
MNSQTVFSPQKPGACTDCAPRIIPSAGWHWLRIGRWFLTCQPGSRNGVPKKFPGASPGSLLEVLQVGRDEFWSWHCTFRAAPFKSPQPLLGVTRTTDLGINVVIPCYGRALLKARAQRCSGQVGGALPGLACRGGQFSPAPCS